MICFTIINLTITASLLQTTSGEVNENTPPTIYLNRNWILSETDPVGYIVEHVQAEDNEQTKLGYGLEIKNEANSAGSQPPLPFAIDNSTGIIRLNETLEGRGGQAISLYVTVTDGKLTAKSEVYVNIQSAANSTSEVKRSSLINHPSNIGLLRPPIIRLPSTNHPIMQSQQLLRTQLKAGLLYLNPNELNRIYPDGQTLATTSTANTTLHFEVGSSIAPPDQNERLNLMPMFVVCVIVLCFGIGTWLFRKWYYPTTKLSQDNKLNLETTISEIQNESLDLQRSQNKKTSKNNYPIWKSIENIKIKHTDDKWEFPRYRLKISTILGEGCFGQVWKCEALEIHSCPRTTIVAVKTLKDNATEREKLDFAEELKIMKSLQPHPNVVRLLGCCTERDPVFVILEYVSGGKLQSFLRTSREGRNQGYLSLTSRDLTSFVYQVAKGMENLASKCIIHRDLAARNVLIDENRVCKVADFGFARDVTADQVYERKSEGRLPIRWMAPESLFDNIFSVKSDVWSFGILIWEIVTLGSTPYPGFSAAEVIKRIKEGYRLDRPEHCKRELYNIMYYCWDKEPSCRPSFSELVTISEGLLMNETDYIELDRFPDHSYYNIINLSGEKL